MPNLLFEIGSEEIPTGYLLDALQQMKAFFTEKMTEYRLSHGEVWVSGTPRRMVLFCRDLAESGSAETTEIQGPSAKAAFDAQGKPTAAAEGFCRAQKIAVQDLVVKEMPKGSYCFAVRQNLGARAREILPGLLAQIVLDRKRVSFPKTMTWKSRQFYFARPVRWLVALWDEEVLPVVVEDLHANRLSRGHPFLAKKNIRLAKADLQDYQDRLLQHSVMVDMERRKAIVREKVEHFLQPYGSKLTEESLLDEVTNLVEIPNVLQGRFDERFLALPSVILEEAMKEHQRYFPVHTADGQLAPAFLTVFNRLDKHGEAIRQGNERVLTARLNDAEFFWKEDRRKPLKEYREALRQVVYQARLGKEADSIYHKTERLRGLGKYIAGLLGLNNEYQARVDQAACLCKCDLVTQVVGEFPSLQGHVGRACAMADGEDQEVAEGIFEHYLPRFLGDALPATPTGYVLALADKFDILCCCFALGLEPTGSGDPYSLRRHALGILRILREGRLAGQRLNLSLRNTVDYALARLPASLCSSSTMNELGRRLTLFIQDRLRQVLVEEHRRYDLFDAALAGPAFDEVVDFLLRLESLESLSRESNWDRLVEAVERSYNIVKKVVTPIPQTVDPTLFQHEEEKELWRIHEENRQAILTMIEQKDYPGASRRYLSAYADSLHRFFAKVFVMDHEHPSWRDNRLALLKSINDLYRTKVADLSQVIRG